MRNKTYIILICIFCTFIFNSCKTIQYVPIETIRTEKEYINLIRIDSIYMKDSIYIRALNDTVFIDKYQYIYRNIYIADTVSILKVDSIPYPVKVEVDKIIYKRKFIDTVQIWLLYMLLPMIIILYLWNWLKNKFIPFI